MAPHKNVKTLGKVVEDSELSEELFTLAKQVYDEGHMDSPRSPHNLEEKKVTFHIHLIWI